MAKRITESAVKKEIAYAKRRLKTIEAHTGASLTLNDEAILSEKNYSKALKSLKKIRWQELKKGSSFSHDYINMKVKGHFYKEGSGWMDTVTEVQGPEAVDLLKAVAHREKVTKQREKISISGEKNIKKAIDYFEHFKTRQQYERYLERNDRKVADNFIGNLRELKKSNKLTSEDKKKISELIRKIKKDKVKWAKIIKDKKLYDMNGVNMFDSDDVAVDIADNYDIIMDELNETVFASDDFKELSEEDQEDVKKSARKKATNAARKAGKKKLKEIDKQVDEVIGKF